MLDIWSKNRNVNIAINILLFLMGINFLHYGQIALPIICLILFIDNKYKFKVNNISSFIILCVFGITFFVFSYKMGPYSVIGLFLPMAYYIGSNIYEVNEKKIRYIIYLLAVAMACHVVLNMVCDLMVRGFASFNRNSHLDFWTWDEYPQVQTAINYVFMIGIIYYVFVYEKNKKIRNIIFISFILIFIYEIALGRRTPVFMLCISIFLYLFTDVILLKNRSKLIKGFLGAIGIVLALLLLIAILYVVDLAGIRAYISNLGIYKKFAWFGFESHRPDIFREALVLAPNHMFGGMEISAIIGWEVHDLWMDCFDYAGIVPFIVLIIHSIFSGVVLIKTVINKELSKDFRLLIFVLFSCIIIQMMLEPIMTGSSIFLLSSVLVISGLENLQKK